METAVQKIEHQAGTEIGALTEVARDFLRLSKSEKTIRAYRSDWRHFVSWCQTQNRLPLPAAPETVALYVTELAAAHRVSTITRRVVAINQAHLSKELPSPTGSAVVRGVMAGIRRAKGTAPVAKAPALMDDIRNMVAALPAGVLGVRDRALLLVCFAGAFRRSEVVALDTKDCSFTREGLIVTLRRSKTDQEGAGRKVALPYGSSPDTCPVRALQAWLDACGAGEGDPVFRRLNRHGHILSGRLSDKAVARTVKRYAAALGLDPAKYAGHSLRAGLATSAAIAGASERSIMAQTGHRSVNMVRVYIRDGNLFRDNAAAKVGM